MPAAVVESPEWAALTAAFPADGTGDAGDVLAFLAVAHPEIRADREAIGHHNELTATNCEGIARGGGGGSGIAGDAPGELIMLAPASP